MTPECMRAGEDRRKVLQIIYGMNRGGVETWLMHVLRNIDRDQFEFHFLVEEHNEAAYDREIRALGACIHRIGNHRNVLRYASEFMALVEEHGPFDVIHSHVYSYSGFVMWLAKRAGIPTRIAHSHTAINRSKRNVARRSYEQAMRYLIRRYATHRIAISEQAGRALFGTQTKSDCFGVLYYGLDFRRFLRGSRLMQLRNDYNIPQGRKVIGHIGRFVPVKNHRFLLECVDVLIKQGEDVHLLCVGEGPLLETLKASVYSRGLTDRCTFAGAHDDVMPFLYAMNVLALPSLWEGLGIVALEAQAAGVPVLASAAVPREVDVVPGMVEHLSLADGITVWTRNLLRIMRGPTIRTGNEVDLLERSRFALSTCLEQLKLIYCETPGN